MLITSIKQSSPGRFTVGMEDGEQIKSTLAALTDLRIFKGKELDEEQLEEFRRCSMRSLSKERAVQMASRRLMSHKELHDKLIQKGADEETACYCADWLEEQGFINDENYAAAVVRHYAQKGYGPGRVRTELMRRGISRELWDAALENMPEQDSKIDKFIASRLKDPEDRDQIRKISGALYRRGYSWEEIRSAMERLSAGTEEWYE